MIGGVRSERESKSSDSKTAMVDGLRDRIANRGPRAGTGIGDSLHSTGQPPGSTGSSGSCGTGRGGDSYRGVGVAGHTHNHTDNTNHDKSDIKGDGSDRSDGHRDQLTHIGSSIVTPHHMNDSGHHSIVFSDSTQPMLGVGKCRCR